MDMTHQEQKTTTRSEPNALCATIRSALNEIADEVGTALQEAGLDFPIYLTVPFSGDALATIACSLDPSDSDWSQALAIVSRIVGKRLGDVRLRGRELVCASANETIAAADATDCSTQSTG